MPILPRRDFLVGALGAAACAATGREGFAATAGARRIDVHHHYSPPAYLAYTRSHQAPAGSRIGGTTTGSAYPGWNLEADLADMDASGVQTAMLSMTTPGFGFGERDEVRSVSRVCNEYAARLKSDHPGRFGSFATIPMRDADGALMELAYALDTLKAEGIGLYSSYGDRWLGDASFDPICAELDKRKCVIYVHPIEADCCRSPLPEVSDTIVEYGADTTRAIANLIFTGTTTRYPNIKWIFSHAGGMMPFVIERFIAGTSVEIVPGIVTKGQGANKPPNAPAGALAEIRKMYFDCAQASNPVAMRALKQVAGVSQILFGTDYWYRSAKETVQNLNGCGVFDEKELDRINRGNALALLPSLKAI
jgi:predicted TIM-barrel fold metal-dependent hydrolase